MFVFCFIQFPRYCVCTHCGPLLALLLLSSLVDPTRQILLEAFAPPALQVWLSTSFGCSCHSSLDGAYSSGHSLTSMLSLGLHFLLLVLPQQESPP